MLPPSSRVLILETVNTLARVEEREPEVIKLGISRWSDGGEKGKAGGSEVEDEM